MKKRRIDWLWVLAAIAVAAGAAYVLWPRPVQVDLAEVTRGPLVVTIDEDGKTRVKERFIVTAPLAGQMLRIDLEEGDPVETGKTLLASIEPVDPTLLDARTRSEAEARVRSAEAAREQAAAEVEEAREAREIAKHEFERIAKLVKTKAVTESEYDRAEHEERLRAQSLRSAEFARRVAEFELDVAKAALLHTQPDHNQDAGQRMELHSPITGRVLRVLQESATVVTPGLPLLELGDAQDMEIEVDVLSSDAARIRPGARMFLEHWGGEKPLEARVRLVEPSGFTKISSLGVEEQRVNVIADFVSPLTDREGLGDAYRVEARIVVWEKREAMLVPAGCLFRRGQEWAVYVVGNGRAHLTTVQVGRTNGVVTEVHSGLAPAAQIILHPGDKVNEGTWVQRRSSG
jgi:HlyD family secretion protein